MTRVIRVIRVFRLIRVVLNAIQMHKIFGLSFTFRVIIISRLWWLLCIWVIRTPGLLSLKLIATT